MRSFFVHISASSSAVFCLSLGFFGFGIRFGTILASIWLLGSQKGTQGGPQGAKGTPRGGQRGAKEAKGRPREAIERRKGAHGEPKGGQGRPKGGQREGKGMPGEASLVPFAPLGGLPGRCQGLGSFWIPPFWVHFGIIFQFVH